MQLQRRLVVTHAVHLKSWLQSRVGFNKDRLLYGVWLLRRLIGNRIQLLRQLVAKETGSQRGCLLRMHKLKADLEEVGF